MENRDIDSRMGLGKSALDRGDYAEAFRLLISCAAEGNAEAQAIIGFLYYSGSGIERDLHKAVTWLTKAAEHGRGDAAHNLGTLYLTCEPDIPQNAEESRRWYLKARDLGFVVTTSDWYEKLEKQKGDGTR